LGPQLVVHVCVVASQDWFPAQSAAELQPHLSPLQTCPFGEVRQLMQASPPAPQASFAVPAAHAPALQQPPLHACPAPQVRVHARAVASHALPPGQSAAVLQPHTSVERHAWPTVLVVQSRQAVPMPPHAGVLVPGLQEPRPQHPAAQGADVEHATTQRCVTASQVPFGQSVVPAHPQTPPPAEGSQAVPVTFPAQLAHRPPLSPHASTEVPG
jgi:hypothetical protein